MVGDEDYGIASVVLQGSDLALKASKNGKDFRVGLTTLTSCVISFLLLGLHWGLELTPYALPESTMGHRSNPAHPTERA